MGAKTGPLVSVPPTDTQHHRSDHSAGLMKEAGWGGGLVGGRVSAADEDGSVKIRQGH